jgi:parallel beta-helix repeat protein
MEAGWLIEDNIFESCPQGVYLNGGRENVVTRNTFINCSDFAFGWAVHSPCGPDFNKTAVCYGGFIDQLNALRYTDPPWSTAFDIDVTLAPCYPALNVVAENRFCHPPHARPTVAFDKLVCGTTICGEAQVASWNSSIRDNVEFACPATSSLKTDDVELRMLNVELPIDPPPLRPRMLQEAAVGNAASAGPELVVAGGSTLALALALSLGLGVTAYAAVDPVAPNKPIMI